MKDPNLLWGALCCFGLAALILLLFLVIGGS